VAPAAGAGFAALALARRLAGPDIDAGTTHELLRSLPHNVTTEMDLRLWAPPSGCAPTGRPRPA
jgi:pyruvate,water dikinase